MATRAEVANSEAIKQNTQDTLDLETKLTEMATKKQGRREDLIKLGKEDLATMALAKKEREQEKKALKEISDGYSEVGDRAKAIGDSIDGFVKSIPGGDFLSKALGVDGLGQKMEDNVIGKIQESFMGTQDLKKGFTLAFGPIGIALGVLTALVGIIVKARSAARDLGKDLGISAAEAGKMLPALKASEFQFKMMGLDGDQLKLTLTEIGKEFGSMENMTVANVRNIEKFAQMAGVAGTDVVKLNKVFMDLDGLSFDAATNVSKTAASLAKAAGVSTDKVIGDMASNAADFARFSMEGAEGFAKAAVEAAKVGSSLSEILKAADSLIDFETSISAQFKAQVLTGKQINTEKARQLALDGDIAGLTNEIQSIVGSVGDIQSLNVIQRKSVADSIGISVADLLRISRGEQAQQQETVQDKLNVTNKLLAESLDISQSQLDELIKPTTLSPSLF
jgi:hypothetical protein|tara:strand:+ start:437 stop:1789 length:1353 start_codon:yes stop_codon:yes gene_type:complete